MGKEGNFFKIIQNTSEEEKERDSWKEKEREREGMKGGRQREREAEDPSVSTTDKTGSLYSGGQNRKGLLIRWGILNLKAYGETRGGMGTFSLFCTKKAAGQGYLKVN